MTKSKLIILSDIWGELNKQWTDVYIENMSYNFDITYLDIRKLAEIDLSLTNQEDLHQAFIDGGIEKAVNALLDFTKEGATILAISMGGTIAWKASLKGLKATSLHLVSATRIRYEEIAPTVDTTIYFGELDNFQPTPEWIGKMELKNQLRIFKNLGHECYREKEVAKEIIKNLLR